MSLPQPQPQNTQSPIQLTIPPALIPLTTPLQTYLATHPHSSGSKYTNLVLGALIFHYPTPTTQLRLLLLRRAATERAYPLRWEVPGGSSEASDPTILHSLAREVFEETGLMVCRFVRRVGGGVEFVTGSEEGAGERRWLKVHLEVEVLEVHDGGRMCGAGCRHGDLGEGAVEGGEGDGVEVRLDPEEHEEYVWATEEDVGRDRYPITTPEQKEIILEGFALRRGDGEWVEALVGGSQEES